jgi:predicted secreted Zn-dependent protease
MVGQLNLELLEALVAFAICTSQISVVQWRERERCKKWDFSGQSGRNLIKVSNGSV